MPNVFRDDRGNVAILFALGFVASIFAAALAVDTASLYQERRQLQAGVDLASISAARDFSRATEIARSVLVEARLLAPAGADGLTVTLGRYDPGEPDIAGRFRPSTTHHNAVSVTLERPGRLLFAAGFTEPPQLNATGIAAVTPEVAFSVGSRLASLNGGLANAILSALLGTSVTLSVMDYNALAAARVDVLSFLDALALELDVTAGTYDDLLQMEADAGDLADALSTLVDSSARAALSGLVSGPSGAAVPLGKLFALGRLSGLELGSGGGLDLAVSALEVLTAAAALADGDRQVSLDLGMSVPGLTRLRLDMAIGEPPQGGGWFAVGTVGSVVRTAQLRLQLRAELLGGPILLGAGVSLPLWLDMAHAEAMVVAATCPGPSAPNGRAIIAARPGVLHTGLGRLDTAALTRFGALPPRTEVDLIDVLLLKVSGAARLEIAATDPVLLEFSSSDIGNGRVRTARTTTPLASLTGSLFSDLDLTVTALGLGLAPTATIARAVRDLLVPLVPALDTVIAATLSTLGVGIGEADIRVHAVRCDHSVLVG